MAYLQNGPTHMTEGSRIGDKLIESVVGSQAKVDAHANSKSNPHNVTKEQVGLLNVDNVKQMPSTGGSFTGITTAASNTSYTVGQLRNVFLSTVNPTGGQDGDIWIKYT